MNESELAALESSLAEKGFCVLKEVFSAAELASMRLQLEGIVAGRIALEGRRFQAEGEDGEYAPAKSSGTNTSWRGPQTAYRKISAIEYDPLFLEMIQKDALRTVCTRILGPTVSALRTTMFIKTPGIGGPLPWHQDVNLDWPVSRQPRLAIWFSIDPVSERSGALEVVPGSHKHGAIGTGHLLPRELEALHAPEADVVMLLPEVGDVFLFDAALLHRSGINTGTVPRRAVNVILCPGEAIHTARRFQFPVLFGDDSLRPATVKNLQKVLNH